MAKVETMTKAETSKKEKSSSPAKETKPKATTAKPAAASTTKKAAPPGGKKVNPYNVFMKTEIAKVKADDSSLSHRDAFKVAARNWAGSDKNPKNAS
ncbi:hypothetical protein HK099_005941 [Clydaea vesicula]|uniref:YABBY protein C-terminal domain-containing protein n=1 Tax=Clydaea vesicula TaxID=447962 RepID=A0AAD5XZC2_9FUNG|nr:hypothetical protein HK099_005941 [Clydaea vesicula]KAJ3385112.1 hypothetical protein HDU92_003249 [Lobulomyces angularis]